MSFDRVNPQKHTVAGYGRTMRQADRALVLAAEKAGDFREEMAPEVKIPTGDFRIRIKKFPSAGGYVDLYAMPFKNTSFPYPLTALENGGKTVLQAVLTSRGLEVSVNGKSVTVSGVEFPFQHYRHIQLVWDGSVTRIFIERRERAVVDSSPQMADHAVLFAGFQGLVDEFSMGSGVPVTIDPEFDGKLEDFPEIKGSKNLLDANLWKSSNRKLLISPENKAVNFSWKGDPQGVILHAGATNEVDFSFAEGDYIRGDFSWLKKSWSYGSRMRFRLVFYNGDGKVIRNMSIDGRTDIKGYVFPMNLSEFYTGSAIGVPMSYFNYYAVPKGAVKLRFEVSFSGNPAEVLLSEVKFRKIDPSKQPWFREPYDVQKIHETKRLSRAEVADVLTKRERVFPELRRVGDRVEIFINGKLTPCQIFINPAAGDYRWINGFKAAGFPFYLSCVSLGRSCSFTEYSPVWKEDGTIDIAPLQEAVYKVLRYDPDAMIFLSLSITPPRSYLEANKEELMVNEKCEYAVMRDFAVRGLYSKKFPDQPGHSWYPSTASRKYRADVAEVIKKALGEFEKTPESKVVAGIYVTGGDDGQFRFPPLPDFSVPALRSYREFLKKLGRDNADRAGMPNPENFKKPPFPKYGDSAVADYQKWSTLESYYLRQSMYQAVKNAMPRVLVGGYENAMGLTGQPGFGRYKIGELLRHKTPDFLISLPGYNRYRDDCDHPSGMKAFNGSMVLHKKLMIGEMDIRNPENGPLGINNRSRNYQATHNADTFRNFLTLYASYCISWGGGFHAYMMQPMWWNTERAVAAWVRAAEITRHARGQELDRNRIAVFGDENSSYYHSVADIPSFHSRIHYRESTQYSLWRSGVRCDYYLAEDALHEDFDAPKIMLFADAGTMTPEFAAKVREKWGRDGRMIIFVGNAGYLPEGDVKSIEKITSFKLKKLSPMPYELVGIDGKVWWEPAFFADSYPDPVFAIEDKNVEVLAYYGNTGIVGAAMKKYPDHTEIYFGQPGNISPDFIRSLAKKCGIRPVQEIDDLCVIGGGLLEIGAMTRAGKRRIYFPNGVKKLTLLTGQKITGHGEDFVEVDLPYKDAAVFKMEK